MAVSPINHSDKPVQRSDGELLTSVAAEGSQKDFELLVQRHARMVIEVCRRQLSNPTDAEDATQAVFIVLWKKADSLKGRQCVAGWLHFVARNVCNNARKAAAIRHARETEAAAEMKTKLDSKDDDRWREIREVLDDEIARLPEKYRLPLVLCYLEGYSYEEAAEMTQTGSSALAMRLSRARQKLRTRLVKRGVAIGAAALGAAISANASTASVSTAFISKTASAAAGATVTAPVAALVQGGLKGLLVAKLQLVGVGMGACAILLGAYALLAQRSEPTAAPASNAVSASELEVEQQLAMPDSAFSDLTESELDGAGRITFFVSQNHPNADDGNPGTADQPWKTMARAYDNIQPGDVVEIGAGVYRETLRPEVSGESGRTIFWRAEPGAIVVLTNPDVGVSLANVSHVTIAGFIIENTKRGVEINDCLAVAIRQCTIRNTGHEAIRLQNTRISVIRDNVILRSGQTEGTSGSGISIGSLPSAQAAPADSIQIVQNDISQTGGSGIVLQALSRKCQVISNRIHDLEIQDGAGVLVLADGKYPYESGHSIHSNLVLKVSTDGVRFQSAASAVNNVIIGCGQYGLRIGDPFGQKKLNRISQHILSKRSRRSRSF